MFSIQSLVVLSLALLLPRECFLSSLKCLVCLGPSEELIDERDLTSTKLTPQV